MTDPAHVELMVSFALRLVAAVLATLFVVRIARGTSPLTLLARRLSGALTVVPYWCLVVGALSSLDLVPSGFARTLYTVAAVAGGLVFAALLAAREGDPRV